MPLMRPSGRRYRKYERDDKKRAASIRRIDHESITRIHCIPRQLRGYTNRAVSQLMSNDRQK
jgi:hypothetical protein